MAVEETTIGVNGVRCERCVARLATTLRRHPGLVQASANLVGEVRLAWDDEITSRDDVVAALARAGFPEKP